MKTVRRGCTASVRAKELPVDSIRYWQSGQFDQRSLPAGLTREHRLKEGTWGLLTLMSGTIDFSWDDSQGGTVLLSAPARMVIPPTVPHHVAGSGPFTLEIEFYRQP
jgi:tellurite resistance-related uncharacterized protein